MKKLLKMTAIAALTFASVSAFAASQQAEEVKKFDAWEEATRDKVSANFDAVTNAVAANDAAGAEAAAAEFDKKAAEYVAELEALGIKSAEASPLVGLYKDYITAEKEAVQVMVAQAKSPSAENGAKIPEATAKAKEKEALFDKLVDELEEKFPADE